MGARGVIVHAVGASAPALAWLDGSAAALRGLETCVAIGSRGPSRWDTALADPAIRALQRGHRVMLDAEGAWDPAAGKPAMMKVVDRILNAVPTARGRVADCSWWAPNLHSGFPTSELGRLCATRYPQCYPTVSKATGLQADGAAGRCLAHARRIYPRYGSPASTVFPTVRGYARTAWDACVGALAEPTQLVYLGSRPDGPNRLTPQVRRGLEAAKRVRDAGGVVAYQRAAGLTPDGLVGPKTLASLGL